MIISSLKKKDAVTLRQKKLIEKLKVNRKKQTLYVAGQQYKYNAFSYLGNIIKIYTSEGEIILPFNL